MLIAVATQRGSSPIEVRIVGVADDEAEEGEAHSEVEPKDGPSPIAPELKELAWGAGAFVVFAVLMRLVLYPRMKKGMEARYASIRAGHEDADALRHSARAEVADYQTQLAGGEGRVRRPRRRCPTDARSRTPGPTRGGERPHRRASGGGDRPGRGGPRRGSSRDRRGSRRSRVEHRRTGDREATGQRGDIHCRVGGDVGGGRAMRLVNAILVAAAEEPPHVDDNGQIVTHHWLLPEQSEIIYGTIASLIIFALLYKFAGPPMRKGLIARTERIQAELDASAAALAEAEAEAAEIRQALGNIEEERERLLAAADVEAEALLTDGRARLEVEIAELEARAAADLEAVASRSGDELRSEIIRVAGAVVDDVVVEILDDANPTRSDRELHTASWSEHMSDEGRIDGYARALFEIARAEGTLDEVEDELFRFARTYESNEALREALTDEMVPAATRQAVVEDLLGNATATTIQLVSMVVGSGRGRDLPAIIDSLVQRASASKNLEVAEVRSAVPLTDDQQDRLKAALTNATGKQVNLKVIVDPSVLGGIVATVGDTVIDGSVRTRVDQLKSRL